ncbi:MAG: hypothetical protein P0Y62_16040 [Candidatus Chryseobacterium colombiense]|nr:hypothetical protein [Chryseobacterium sp.]WEK69348.1 MAG: hypothetical protein P0Y62_16040 [Chryseobacterium sp.]
MKKLLLIIPMFLFSCKKENSNTEIRSSDSVTIKQTSEDLKDSVIKKQDEKSPNSITKANNNIITEEENGRVIMKTVEGKGFPIIIQEEFTKDHDKLILKISNYSKPQLKAKIITRQNDFNIRFNQIKLPDGKMDGPFGREITYDIPEKGEVWLIVGKNNMADGEITGTFSVKIE